MFQQLSDKCIIITGAGSASGIGAGLALGLAERGANIAVCDINLSGAEQVAADVAEKTGGKTIAINVDVTNRVQMQSMIARTVEKFGRLDVMINNAGIIEHASFLD